MDAIQPVTAVAVSGAFVFGMVLALLGSFKLALARGVDVGAGNGGRLLPALNLALIPMTLLSGLLVDYWAVRGVVIAGSVLLALSLLALSARPSHPRTLLALL